MLRDPNIAGNTKVFMKVETTEHQLQLDFYRKVREAEGEKEIDVLNFIDQVSVGDQIIISQQENLKLIQDKFIIDTLKTWSGIGYEIQVKSEK